MKPFERRTSGDITWRIVHTIAGITGRTDFGEDSSAAEEFFQANVRGMEESPVLNDRVVLYRINTKGPGWTYQDPYKFAIMSPHGLISRYAPYSPRTWEDAGRIVKKLREQRRR